MVYIIKTDGSFGSSVFSFADLMGIRWCFMEDK